MEEFMISRRQGLKALGATIGAATLGAGLITTANAAPGVRPNGNGSPLEDGVRYTLTVVNASAGVENMCLYQYDPNIGSSDILPLGWFSKPAPPTAAVVFNWTVDYSFVWSMTGVLRPGGNFKAVQTLAADPNRVAVTSPGNPGNQIGFTCADGKFCTFTPVPTPGAKTGTLYIAEDPTIPLNQASVGIAMAGSGVYAVQARHDQSVTFTPSRTPVYYLTAGNFVRGEVLGPGVVDGSAEIAFPPGAFQAIAVFQKDNTWTVKYG